MKNFTQTVPTNIKWSKKEWERKRNLGRNWKQILRIEEKEERKQWHTREQQDYFKNIRKIKLK